MLKKKQIYTQFDFANIFLGLNFKLHRLKDLWDLIASIIMPKGAWNSCLEWSHEILTTIMKCRCDTKKWRLSCWIQEHRFTWFNLNTIREVKFLRMKIYIFMEMVYQTVHIKKHFSVIFESYINACTCVNKNKNIETETRDEEGEFDCSSTVGNQ